MVLTAEIGAQQEKEQGRRGSEEEQKAAAASDVMCCYVGKATKIFLCLVAALLVAGLVFGFGLARHRAQQQPDCRWPNCQQQQGLAFGGEGPLLPATATTPTNPLTQPAVAAFPGATATSSPSSSSSSAAPPMGVPYFGPPTGPFVVGLGPAAHA